FHSRPEVLDNSERTSVAVADIGLNETVFCGVMLTKPCVFVAVAQNGIIKKSAEVPASSVQVQASTQRFSPGISRIQGKIAACAQVGAFAHYNVNNTCIPFRFMPCIR